ncbi:hypothetical protein O6H91_06G081400 [Diphasiastrum complanatum]|uniref:Uncharacterized protein n=2 Tax=Diphasiastrum complanatum TaxID=34168 RepID=A0ACC2DFI6_DIPCM|nr:hypothetical protein O6H91_06G081400 [Diphasiastrum complanatum]KAJ7553021.1 hypothetical protein O6H91_06G081400 [Diphasiastrum complanatum]
MCNGYGGGKPLAEFIFLMYETTVLWSCSSVIQDMAWAQKLQEGAWVSFCGSSASSAQCSCINGCIPLGNSTQKGVAFIANELDKLPCLQNASLAAVQVLFIVAFLLMFICCKQSLIRLKPTPTSSRFLGNSYIRVVLIFLSEGLGLTNLAVAGWLLGTNALPMKGWFLLVVQGLSWIVIGFSVNLQLKQASYFKRFTLAWWGITSVVTVYLVITSVFGFIHSKCITLNALLSVITLPVSCLLILFSLKLPGNAVPDIGLAEPFLNSNSSDHLLRDKSHTTPFASSSFFDRLTFRWLNPLLSQGQKSPLKDTDIPYLATEDQAESVYKQFIRVWDQQNSEDPSKRASLFWALATCHWGELVVNGTYALIKSIALGAGPFLLYSLIKYASGARTSHFQGYLLVVVLFMVKMVESLSQRQWYFGSRRVGMNARSALIGAIYRKQLRLSSTGRQSHATGQMLNYLAVDAYQIGEFPYWLHLAWAIPLQIVLSLATLFFSVGWATFVGLALILLTMGFNSPMAKLQQKYQTLLMTAQDERLRSTNEVLRNMKILKLQAWEEKFRAKIDSLRFAEHKCLSTLQYNKTFNSLLYWFLPIVVSTATYTACYVFGIPLTPSNVFTALATLRIVQEPIRILPDLIAVIIQVKVSFSRLNKFLHEDELQADVQRHYTSSSTLAIMMRESDLSWNQKLEKRTLRNISLQIQRGDKVAICGEVGSGKSSLLHAILGEIPKTTGQLKVNGSLAYVAQTAWIQSGTIRDNILFGRPMDKIRYEETLKACALDKDLNSFPFGDFTEIGERGINMSGGQKQRIQLARAVYQDADVYLLDDPFSAVDAHTGSSLFKDCVMGALAKKTVVLVTHQVEFLPAVNQVLLMHDGEIRQAGDYYKLLQSGEDFKKLVTAQQGAMNVVGDVHATTATKSSRVNSMKHEIHPNSHSDTQEIREMSSAAVDQLTKQEERESGNTGLKAYFDYLNQAKGFSYFAIATASHIIFCMGQMGSNYWLAHEIGNPKDSTSYVLEVFAAIGMSTGCLLFARATFVVIMGLSASSSFYSGLMSSIFHAPMSFFDSTPMGRVLSRLSSDLSILDVEVPFSFSYSMSATLNALSVVVIIAIVTWKVLIFIIPMIYINHWFQQYYLDSAQELMRIIGTTKSPIVHHFGEAIFGAATIRAFKREDQFMKRNLHLIDVNASPYFHSFAASEWLIQRLETLSAFVLGLSAFLMIMAPAGSIKPGLIGLALSYGLSLNVSLVCSVQNQCILANWIVSVERIKQYMHIPSEAPAVIEDHRPAPTWPPNGNILLNNLQVRYRPDTPLVLKGITCTFKGGQKIGVVGRTGSGKTTLISALFRLVEPAGGSIIIDGIDISSIGLHDLRSRLSIIPQEPTLFRGSVRFNLDPLAEYPDAIIWEALDKCKLGDIVREKPGKLEALVGDDGENWSVGQRQLFCLGRALLKKSRILVLDEATASIDNTTDSILQKTIKLEFTSCTVVTVAHRIPTVIDSDMVMALRDGHLAEFDRPTNLLEQRTSLFAKLVAEYMSHSHHVAEGNNNQ